jgi:hypothetical protein
VLMRGGTHLSATSEREHLERTEHLRELGVDGRIIFKLQDLKFSQQKL